MRWTHPLAIAREDQSFVAGGWSHLYGQLLERDDFLDRLVETPGGLMTTDLDLALREWPVVADHFGEELEQLRREPAVMTGHMLPAQLTTIHHLYHLAMYERTTGFALRDAASIIEWGGGFGSLARLCKARNPAVDYTIVDLPYMLAAQRRYLSRCEQEGICTDGGFHSVTPSQSLDLTADVFIATWSLEECGLYAQETVAKRTGFFGAPHLLLAFQPANDNFEDAVFFPEMLPSDVALVPTAIPESRYAFR